MNWWLLKKQDLSTVGIKLCLPQQLKWKSLNVKGQLVYIDVTDNLNREHDNLSKHHPEFSKEWTKTDIGS